MSIDPPAAGHGAGWGLKLFVRAYVRGVRDPAAGHGAGWGLKLAKGDALALGKDLQPATGPAGD